MVIHSSSSHIIIAISLNSILSAKDLNRHFATGEIQMAKKHVKTYST